MNNEKRLPALLFGLIGMVLGATLNHYFASERQEQSKLLELRSSAYMLFLEGQAALQESRQLQGNQIKSEELERKYRETVKEARLQIGVLGSGQQVTAVTDLFLLNPTERICDATWVTDVEIYKAMRRDLIPIKEEIEVDDARLYYLLWNCLPPPLANSISK